MITLTLTDTQAARLQVVLDQAFATSVNHLVSATQATPGGEWHSHAVKLSHDVETDRMLKLVLNRAVTGGSK